MKIEPAQILAIELGAVGFFLLLLPLGTVLTRLRAVWQADRGMGVLLTGMVALTLFFFALFIAGLLAVAFLGAPAP